MSPQKDASGIAVLVLSILAILVGGGFGFTAHGQLKKVRDDDLPKQRDATETEREALYDTKTGVIWQREDVSKPLGFRGPALVPTTDELSVWLDTVRGNPDLIDSLRELVEDAEVGDEESMSSQLRESIMNVLDCRRWKGPTSTGLMAMAMDSWIECLEAIGHDCGQQSWLEPRPDEWDALMAEGEEEAYAELLALADQEVAAKVLEGATGLATVKDLIEFTEGQKAGIVTTRIPEQKTRFTEKMAELRRILGDPEGIEMRLEEGEIRKYDRRTDSWVELDAQYYEFAQAPPSELFSEINRLDGEILELKEEIQEKRVEIFEAERNFQQKIEQKERRRAELELELESEETRHAAAMGELQQERAQMERRLEKMTQAKAVGLREEEADGQVLFSDPEAGYVFINLGKAEALIRLVVFDVYEIQKGSLRFEKGRIQVIEVGPELSKAVILETFDPARPIKVGDMISNIAYDREQVKVFALAGKMIAKYNNTDLRHKIEDFGGLVVDRVGDDTTYLIIGEGFEDDPNYQAALSRNVLILREAELYDLIGIE